MLSNIFKYTNNPGNIRFNPKNRWRGSLPESFKGFCVFKNSLYGLRALIVLLRGYIRKGIDTPSLILLRYAPPSENDYNSYLRFVCGGSLKTDTTIIFASVQFCELVHLICLYETGCSFEVGFIYNFILNGKLSK